jgi:hypothetical protein
VDLQFANKVEYLSQDSTIEKNDSTLKSKEEAEQDDIAYTEDSPQKVRFEDNVEVLNTSKEKNKMKNKKTKLLENEKRPLLTNSSMVSTENATLERSMTKM